MSYTGQNWNLPIPLKEPLESALEALDNSVIKLSNDAIKQAEHNSLVLNDRENNRALSACSTAIGYTTTAGCKGYYIGAINIGTQQIILCSPGEEKPEFITLVNDPTLVYTPTVDEDFYDKEAVEGQYFCIKNGYNFDMLAKVESITGNLIKYTGDIGFDETWDGSFGQGDSNFTFRVPMCPDSGALDIALGSTALGGWTTAAGLGSTALGGYTIAAGDAALATGIETVANYASFAGGSETKALGNSSFAMGFGSVAGGDSSAAFGHWTGASKTGSFATGFHTRAYGASSFASGNTTHALGDFSTALGSNTVSKGTNSLAMGVDSVAEGNSSIATGLYNTALADGSLALGTCNDYDEKQLLSIGNGYVANYDQNTGLLTYTFTAKGTTIGIMSVFNTVGHTKFWLADITIVDDNTGNTLYSTNDENLSGWTTRWGNWNGCTKTSMSKEIFNNENDGTTVYGVYCEGYGDHNTQGAGLIRSDLTIGHNYTISLLWKVANGNPHIYVYGNAINVSEGETITLVEGTEPQPIRSNAFEVHKDSSAYLEKMFVSQLSARDTELNLAGDNVKINATNLSVDSSNVVINNGLVTINNDLKVNGAIVTTQLYTSAESSLLGGVYINGSATLASQGETDNSLVRKDYVDTTCQTKVLFGTDAPNSDAPVGTVYIQIIE